MVGFRAAVADAGLGVVLGRVALGAAVVLSAQNFGAKLSGGLLPELALEPMQWAALAALPVAAVLLVVFTVGLTVKRVLGKMM